MGAALEILAGAVPAVAQPASAAAGDEARRKALYADGVKAAAAGRWQEAKQHFRAVVAIRASPKALFSLAQAEENTGQLVSAQTHYRLALEGARTAAGKNEVTAAAVEAERALEPRVPHVRVVVWGPVGSQVAEAATATLDGQPMAVGTATPVDPGTHEVVVRAAGMRAATTSVALGEGQQLDVPVRLEAEATPPTTSVHDSPAATTTTPPEVRATRGVPWRTVALVAGGAGVVGLGVSAAFAVDAKSKNDQSNASGCKGDNCTPAAASMRRDALSSATASTAAFVVGGLLAAGGVTLWLVAPPESKRGDPPNSSPTWSDGVHISPVALAGGAGIQLGGEWR